MIYIPLGIYMYIYAIYTITTYLLVLLLKNPCRNGGETVS